MPAPVYKGSLRHNGRRVYSIYASGPGLAKRQCLCWARIHGIPVSECEVVVSECFK